MSAHIQARIPDALFRRLEDARGAETRTAVLVRALEREIRRMARVSRKAAQFDAECGSAVAPDAEVR